MRAVFTDDRLARFFACVCAVAMICSVPGVAHGDDDPLYKRTPYDQITLNEHNSGMVYRVETLSRPVPSGLRPSDTITFKLFNFKEEDAEFKAEWHTIAKIETFEQLVLKKANKLVARATAARNAGDTGIARKRLDEAYEYFTHLLEQEEKNKEEGNAEQLPELEPSLHAFLFEEAKGLYQDKMYPAALAMMRELNDLAPGYPGLDNAMGLATDHIAAKYLAKKDYKSVRTLIGNLNDRYKNHSVFVRRNSELKGMGERLFNQATAAVASHKYSEAGAYLRDLKKIYPKYPGARELALSTHNFYPRVVVGVQIPAVNPQPGFLNGWAEQRSGRLLYRTLMEYAGPGTAGGNYECPVAMFEIAPVQRRLTWDIKPDIRWSKGTTTLTGYQVARRLLDATNPDSSIYRVQWAKLLDGLTVDQVYSVDAQLNANFVRPDALLQTTLIPYGTPAQNDDPPLPNGPFIVASHNEQETVYRSNLDYFADTKPGMPKELVERRFPNGATAVEALKKGEIQVLDRVAPWAVSELSRLPNIRLGKYGVPMVHCIVPNLRPLPKEDPNVLTRPNELIREFASLEDALKLATGTAVANGVDPAEIVMKEVEALQGELNIDPLLAKGKMLRSFAVRANTPPEIVSLTKAANQLIDDAIAVARFDLASIIAEMVIQACEKTPDTGAQKDRRDKSQAVDPAVVEAQRKCREAIQQRQKAIEELADQQRYRRALTSDRSFRRALVYAIPREAILQHLLRDKSRKSDQKVISGPFPPGVDFEDGLGYASDKNLRPRQYDPRMALILANVALKKVTNAEKKRRKALALSKNPEAAKAEEAKVAAAKAAAKAPSAQDPAAKAPAAPKLPTEEEDDFQIKQPTLVLAHSGGETAEMACKMIERKLELLGIPIELRKLPSPAPQRIPEDVDLLYTELAMWEPVVDARRLLGEHGLSGGCSSYMDLALRELDSATNWPTVRTIMHRIHEIAHRDLAVIPLWQMVNSYAVYDITAGKVEAEGFLETLGKSPITLYQNIEEWKIPFQYPDEEE